MGFQLSDKHWRRVRRLLRKGQTLEEIASTHFENKLTAIELEHRMALRTQHDRTRRAAYRKRVREGVIAKPEIQRVRIRHIPSDVLADRERRQNAPETPNTIWFGDPVVPRWMSNKDSKPRTYAKQSGPWAW